MENGSYSSSSEASSVSSLTPSDDVEVRKLKDLVKKLEKQNEHLRHRTGKLSSSANKLNKSKSDNLAAGGDASTAHSAITTINGLPDNTDDVKELDENDPLIRSVVHGDDMTWLYESPKSSIQDDDDKKFSSPLDWLNDEFENPSTPQLASARRNIMYKIGLSLPDNSSPDLSYLTEGIEKRLLFNNDDYKMEDATDVKVVARLQQEELTRDSQVSSQRRDAFDGPPLNNTRRRSSSHDRDTPKSPSAQFSHHLPVPSQTRTTTHGLYPAHADQETPVKRSLTPTKLERSLPSSIGSSPRTGSPARSRQGQSPNRRSLQTPSRSSSSLPARNQSPSRHSQLPDSPRTNPNRGRSLNTPLQQPSIRSSLVAPGRMSRLQQKSSLPNPAPSPGLPSGTRTLSAPRAVSPVTPQRRSLPRPSQTKLRYSSAKTSHATSRSTASPAPAPSPPADIWGDDEVY